MSNRRELARIPVKRVMRPLQAGFGTETLSALGQIVNLSKAGMFIASDELTEPGDTIKVRFEDANGAKMAVIGTVRWTTAADEGDLSGFGIKIAKPPADYLAFCEELLDVLGIF